ncbi:probable E3 ubiquitin-protein ligase HERC6 [Eublepharis macularius]|uniref:Probable E3 ubiquitin-protein ligase HERC6 n=1 Tax=Eublepharis macularius TaxID=481883 RepID=A0AA97L9B0_EUBMA|nr:probable E3 ubiquitin-protein ligase HERC6 [Eublepharis macularius]
MLYCWGEGASGQLGLGDAAEGRSEPIRFRPGPDASSRRGAALVACGERHTLLLHADGSVSSCGDNARGQLGRRLPAGRQCGSVPERIRALEAQAVVYVSCGKEHSIAVCSNRRVFSWGAGSFGQLGTGELKDCFIPKKIDGLSTFEIIQVACGHYHSIALAKDGRVFSWGQNTHGQLGVGKEAPSHSRPQHVSALDGIPLAQVAAGGAHSFALSLSGVAYAWGRNNAHQLGLSQSDPKEQIFKPCSVAALKNLDVIYISCGAEHTAILTENGSVFTFGDNSAGQLGTNCSAQKRGPQKVDWIDGPVSHLACGSYHTLACISASSRLISFGRGCSEHGTASCTQDETQSFNISALISPNELSGIEVKQVFAGTYANFAIAQVYPAPKCANRASTLGALPKISQLSRALIDEWMSAVEWSARRQKAEREIQVIFSSPPCLTASFLKPRSSLEVGCCITVDLQKAREVFFELTKKDWIALKIFLSVLNVLVHSLPLNSPHQEALSCFLLVPECLDALEAKDQQSLSRSFAETICKLSKRSSDILEKFWSALPVSFFDRIVQMLKKAVVSLLPYYYLSPQCLELLPVLEALQKLYRVNKTTGCKIRLSNFYICEISQGIDLFFDLSRWHTWSDNLIPSPDLSFCRFPFVFDLPSKLQLFHLNSYVMRECLKADAQEALLSNRLNRVRENPKLPIFLLRVQRHNLVVDTLHKLSQVEEDSLKMELVVEFEDEPDRHEASRVLVEFFFCMFDEMVQSDYGMFMYCEQNSPMWFPAKPSAALKKYYLFGILFGLCLCHRILAYVPFPLAAFKKLMGKKPSLDDLKELSPVLGKSLQAILDYEQDDMEENLHLCYNITWDNVNIDLIPDGSSIAVNAANRKDFVSKYVDYIFSKSVEGVFEEFKRGFYKVLDKRVVGFFEPQELMQVAIGDANYDWDVYEKNAVYWGIYSPTHPIIRMFWKVFHELTLADKRGFLLFVSGSFRFPVTELQSVKLKIHSHRSLTEEHIPEAQTCFHLLLLPPYSTEEKLKEKLLQAIENNQGFGKPLSC